MIKNGKKIKEWRVDVPPTLAEVLADIGGTSPDDDFDVIVNAAVGDFFAFYTPLKITPAVALDLEKFVLNYYIMRRAGSGNIRKFRQIFRNKWNAIIPYYERLLETQENESHYFTDPILTANIGTTSSGSGTEDTEETTGKRSTGTNDVTSNGTTTRNIQREGEHEDDTTRSVETEGNGTTASSESGNSSQIDRYSDTPQGDAGDIWEQTTDAQGRPVLRLTDIYLTNIRGITNSYSQTGNETRADNGTEEESVHNAGTSEETVDETGTQTDTSHAMNQVNETGNRTTGTETTSTGETTKQGYDGTSPVDLLMKYRESFLRIYEAIAAELSECFYNLVDINDLTDFV